MSGPAAADTRADKGWRESLATYTHPRVVTFLFLGFSAGLPFLLVFATLSAWLREYGISRTAIGFISWIGITYSFKFVWSPVVDRVPLPLLTRWLGRRRSWMLLAQAGIAGGLLGMSFCDPRTDLWGLVALASLRSNDAAALLAAARRFGAVLGRQGAAAPPVLDLFGGSAGAILAQLALAEATQEALWRDRAVALGDGLIALGQPLSGGAMAWFGKPGEPALTGFAHGSTGIARALAALWRVTGEARFAAAVDGALAFERSRFDARLGDWPVVRPGVGENEERRVAMTAYCHGGAGIALGRALLPAGLRDGRFQGDVDLAVAATLRAGTGDFDHLCCGAAGRLAILGVTGVQLGREDALAAHSSGLERLLARPIRLPGSSRTRPEVEAGLFRGLAGVAWSGLFAAAIGDPSVLDPLALELPSEARQRAMQAKGTAP